MKTKTLFLGLLAAAIALTPLAAAAQPCDGEPSGKHRCKLFSDLKLTADQKTKLKELRTQGEKTRNQYFDRMKGIREQVKAELLKPQPSKQSLDAFAAQLGDIHKELSMERHGHLLKVKEMLTPEQFSKLLDREPMGPGHKGCREHDKDGCREHDKDGCKHDKDGCKHHKADKDRER